MKIVIDSKELGSIVASALSQKYAPGKHLDARIGFFVDVNREGKPSIHAEVELIEHK